VNISTRTATAVVTRTICISRPPRVAREHRARGGLDGRKTDDRRLAISRQSGQYACGKAVMSPWAGRRRQLDDTRIQLRFCDCWQTGFDMLVCDATRTRREIACPAKLDGVPR